MIAKRRVALLAGAFVALGLWGFGAAIAGERPNLTLPYGEVNWDQGIIKVSAVGLPPFRALDAAARQQAARANAIAIAQRRLLGVLLKLDTPHGQVRTCLSAHPELRERLRQLVSSAGVSGDNYADGSVEITLTLKLEGPQGVKAFLRSL